MGGLRARHATASKAVATLREALAVETPSELERDGTVQRFEYSFEAFGPPAQRARALDISASTSLR